MADKHPSTHHPLEQTLEFDSVSGTSPEPPSYHPRRLGVALVEGSTPQISGETHQILRRRLRAVASLLLVSFLAFWIWHIVAPPENPPRGERILFWAHTGVIAIMATLLYLLCPKCNLSLQRVRIAESLVFGTPAVFFLLWDHYRLVTCCEMTSGVEQHVPEIVVPWIVLIFTHALFIPNSWRRALCVLSPLAVAPIAAILYLRATAPSFAAMLALPAYRPLLLQEILTMAIVLLIATVGVATINSLRRQMLEARQLGQYRLKRLIGSGGMGEVWLAEHLLMKRPCAVKIIRQERGDDQGVIARFEREVRLTARLSHWNSIDIYDYGRTDTGIFYYVMEYLPGHNIGEIVSRFGPLPEARVAHLIRQVCAALAEAHGTGMVHRDLKPANIFSALRGGLFDVAKVLDFGLAKPISGPADIHLTQDGAITGSPLYMSPEQASGSEDLDARSDIYSLGAVMYFMLTGQPPFESDKPLKVLIAHASQAPLPPRKLNPQVTRDFEAIVLKCLQKEPADRFQSVTELDTALEAVTTQSDWDSYQAAHWWENYGCPERKRLAAEALEAAGV